MKTAETDSAGHPQKRLPRYRRGRANWILYAGIGSLLVPCLPLGALALVLTYSELRSIDSGRWSHADRGTVLAGFICSVIGASMGATLILWAIVLWSFPTLLD